MAKECFDRKTNLKVKCPPETDDGEGDFEEKKKFGQVNPVSPDPTPTPTPSPTPTPDPKAEEEEEKAKEGKDNRSFFRKYFTSK